MVKVTQDEANATISDFIIEQTYDIIVLNKDKY